MLVFAVVYCCGWLFWCWCCGVVVVLVVVVSLCGFWFIVVVVVVGCCWMLLLLCCCRCCCRCVVVSLCRCVRCCCVVVVVVVVLLLLLLLLLWLCRCWFRPVVLLSIHGKLVRKTEKAKHEIANSGFFIDTSHVIKNRRMRGFKRAGFWLRTLDIQIHVGLVQSTTVYYFVDRGRVVY